MRPRLRLARLLFRGRRRVYTYRWLAGALRQSDDTVSALGMLWRFATDDGVKRNRLSALVFAEWREGLLAGRPLGDVLQAWAPTSHVTLVLAGERAASAEVALPKALETAAWLETTLLDLRRKLLTSFAQPLLVFVMVIALFAYMMGNVIPEFESILPRERWTGVAAYLPSLAWVVLDGPLIVFVAGGIVLSLLLRLVVLPRWKSMARVHFEPLLPFRIYRVFAGTAFLLGLAGLISAKLPLSDALIQLQRGAAPWFQHRLALILERLRAGHALGDALWYADRNFPDLALNRQLRMVFTFREFENIIEELAHSWVKDADATLVRLAGLLRGVVLLANGSLITVLVLSMLSIVGQISQSY